MAAIEFSMRRYHYTNKYLQVGPTETLPGQCLIRGSGFDLPTHPDTMKIEALVNEEGRSASLEELSEIMCRVVPSLSMEEQAAVNASGLEKAWPWFKIGDETVQFTQSSSRWFLAGRTIQSYECR
jgi:hypothetical protein